MGVLSRRSPERDQARRDRHAAVRARIIDATTGLIRDGANYATLSVETIAARTGISRTTFYDYFPDKRELLLAMSGDILEDAIGPEADDYHAPDDHAQTRAELRLMFEALVVAYRHPAVRAIVEATFYDEEVRACLARQHRAAHRALDRPAAQRAPRRALPGPRVDARGARARPALVDPRDDLPGDRPPARRCRPTICWTRCVDVCLLGRCAATLPE